MQVSVPSFFVCLFVCSHLQTDEIPKELQTTINFQQANKAVFAKQLVDLIDKSKSGSCKCPFFFFRFNFFSFQQVKLPKFPAIPPQIYEDSASESNSHGDFEGEFGSEEGIKQAEHKLKEFQIEDNNQETDSKQPLEPKEEKQDANSSSFNIKYSELVIDFSSVIGLGAFGNVYKGTYQGAEVAVKELLNVENAHIRKLILREVEMLK